jgi:pilus assembly protein CpaB
MKPKTMILIGVAVACGLVASIMTSRLIAERNQQGPAEPRMTVLVAKKKILPMTLLKKPQELFVEKEIPVEAVPKKAIKSFEELGKDKRVNKMINEEMFVTTDDLVSKELDGLAATLKPGSRAIALKVNPETLAGGFVLPGSRVDILSTIRDGEAQSQVILQDMLILAVDMQSSRSQDNNGAMLGSTVTLAASLEEAKLLSLATSLGELRLVLRGLGDEEKTRTRPTRRGDLGRPTIGATDAAQAEIVLAQNNATPRIPTDLPPVADTPAQNPMIDMQQEPEQEPVKTHTLTIISGESIQRTQFVQEKDGSYKIGGDRNDAEEPKEAKAPKAKPTWPKGSPPLEKKESAPAKPDAKPQTVLEKLQQNSGLRPVQQ